MTLPPLWPWQARGIAKVQELLRSGLLQICRALFTGGGKTREQLELCRWMSEQGKQTLLFVNQRNLTHQTGIAFTKAGLVPGYLAAGFEGPLSDVRVCSVQTVRTRHAQNLPEADLVIIDECHRRDFDFVLDGYRERGTPVVGYTATPVGLGGKYQVMVQEGTKAEARALQPSPAIVPCYVFAPSEPDMKGVSMTKLGEFNQKAMARRVVQCQVFGDVVEHWLLLNPERRPTLLWAPGVQESRGFVEVLRKNRKNGITAAHVDGETPLDCPWCKALGRGESAPRRTVEEIDCRTCIGNGSRDGTIQIVSSYGVLREGVDWPWICHGILVQVCGALSTFLQLAGRLLRAFPGKDQCVLQDHSGCWHRHGSPNIDRVWTLGDEDRRIRKEKKKRLEAGDEREPICCPQCHAIRTAGPKCRHCGHEHVRSVRFVRTVEGELKRAVGSVVKKKRQVSEDQKTWTVCLYAGAARNRTLRNCWGDFYRRLQRPVPPDVKPQPPQGDDRWDMPVRLVYPSYYRAPKQVEA